MKLKDMTNMTRPQFKQVHPADYKFISCNSEIDEFYYMPTSIPLNELQFCIKAYYHTLYGEINGNLGFNRQFIEFKAVESSVREQLMKETKKQLHEITQEIINRFSFKIHLDDLYEVKEEKDQLQFHLFGVEYNEIPILDHEDEPSILEVNIKLDQAENEEITNIIQKVTQKDVKDKKLSQQILILLNYILQFSRYQLNRQAFKQIVSRYEHKKNQKSIMKCMSQISYYDIIGIKKLEKFIPYERQQTKISTLNKPSGIISQEQFILISGILPQEVCGNSWYQIYNPKFHGNSFNELLRRVREIKEHIILMKIENEIIIGIFLQNGVQLGQVQQFGSQSFIIVLKNNGYQMYKCNDQNECQQKCNQEEICVFKLDQQFEITINQNLQQGKFIGNLTNSNNQFLITDQFNIKEFEIWGVQENCQLIMRHLRLQSDFHLESQQEI